MKKMFSVLFCLSIILSTSLSADALAITAAYGDWLVSSSDAQSDSESSMAKASMAVPQEGTMVYEFKAAYKDGLEDGHGGFGIHVFVDEPAPGKAWGEGDSYLLWLNYDENPADSSIPSGLSAQVYKSTNNSRMDLVQSISLSAIEPLVIGNMDQKLPVKLVIDGNTGMAKVYDPFRADYAYTFKLSSDAPLKGDYVSLRTNGVSVNFSR